MRLFSNRSEIGSQGGESKKAYSKVCSYHILMSNHNHYNFLKCDWYISCFIFH